MEGVTVSMKTDDIGFYFSQPQQTNDDRAIERNAVLLLLLLLLLLMLMLMLMWCGVV